MAVARCRLLPSKENGEKSLEEKLPRKRRVFVQTETGCALGIELDGSDNAHTVKRRLQVALNVPTGERLLVYGDKVLKNDLSIVRNGSPVLLTRNFLHRSSSTPCLSPVEEDFHHGDESDPVELLVTSTQFSVTKQLVRDVVKALEIGMDPIPISSGLGGAYYFRNCDGEYVAIVKPTDEEPYGPNNPKGFVGKVIGQPGLKRSVRVGETGFREVAAFLLDHNHYAKVPPTALVKIKCSIFNINDEVSGNNPNKNQNTIQTSKIASFQQFIPHDFDASDHGTSCFPVSAVHRIGILDVRILNTDRHAGNILVRKLDGNFGQVDLIPIDHGLCLPESLEDPYFEWIHWPQASIPFSENELEYINLLDPVRDSEMLRMELPMIRESCLRILVLCTIFLKQVASFGLCLAEIGEMMTREFHGYDEEPSELEMICIQARKLLEARETWYPSPRLMNKEEFQFDMDCDEELDIDTCTKEFNFGVLGGNGQELIPEMEENFEAEEEDSIKVDKRKDEVPIVSKLSLSLRNVSLGKQSWRHQIKAVDGSYTTSGSSGNRSVNEQLSTSASFVFLADMAEEEWTIFLGNFQKVLHVALINGKSRNQGPRQRQRLGTSCQF